MEEMDGMIPCSVYYVLWPTSKKEVRNKLNSTQKLSIVRRSRRASSTRKKASCSGLKDDRGVRARAPKEVGNGSLRQHLRSLCTHLGVSETSVYMSSVVNYSRGT
ncbi:hypothetical protein CR513_29986, partial [Mucuna pruriens]